jgi:uncharacterized SAM-binding protein YcdF (DUF218 family)
MSAEALEHARRIFDYHQLKHPALPADVMVVLGSNDTRVAEFAAELYHARLSEKLVVTGGLAHQNDLLATGWDRPESEVFAKILTARGVPRDKMMLETHALNTAENLALSRRVIESAGLTPRSILIVVKPFMQRRVMATHAVVWPEMPASLASWTGTFDDYCNDLLPPAKVTNVMMGDLQRIWVYAERGWSAPQQIPDDVKQAFRRLVELGFTEHLVGED